MPGPISGSRHNWLRDSVLEEIQPIVGSYERVAFRHTPHQKSSKDWTGRFEFVKQKLGEPRTFSRWHAWSLFRTELVYTETQRALPHSECAHWRRAGSAEPLSLSISETADEVVVHHADRLHVRVDDG